MPAEPPSSEDPPHVLLVDDDPVIMRLLEVNFGLEGFRVRTATNGEDALERAAEERPDAVVLDVMMPGIDGWEVCVRMREQPGLADVPVVLLSARGEDDDRSRDYALGHVEYVTKPFDPAELIAVVRRHLAAGEPA
ncbi:MAG TPA: response regulator [Actinomycetota bacterium]|jgi:DNA-binding response OmpR family regulator